MENTLKKFMVYMDDGTTAFRVAVPAKDEKTACEYVAGNGDVIAVKDVTEKYPISSGKVISALTKANFDRIEIDFVIRTLNQFCITE